MILNFNNDKYITYNILTIFLIIFLNIDNCNYYNILIYTGYQWKA